MADVFISYSRQDRDHAQALAKLLEEKGLAIWWDWNLVGGVNFRDKIHSALNDAKKVIVLWSEHSVSSSFVIDEAGVAMRQGKLIPILIDESELPLGFGNLHTIKSGRFEHDLDLIVAAVKDQPVPAPPSRSGILALFGPRRRSATMLWFVTLLGSITTMIQAYPVVAGVVRGTLSLGKPENLAVFASDDHPSATQYLTILAERGFKTEFLPLERLSSIEARQARGLVLVRGQRQRTVTIDDATRHLLAGQAKVLGFGDYGSLFIRELDKESMLGKVMHITHTTVNLDDTVKPATIGQGLPIDKPVKLYAEEKVDPMSTVAAYDEGSTAMQGARGIARASAGERPDACKGSHWSVAVQGNLALWGYDLPATSLTPEGRQLFGDLAVYMRDTEYGGDDRTRTTTKPGTVRDQLGCGLTGHSYKFRPTGPGTITAAAHAGQNVALILNAPFQVGFLARQDGRDPQFTYEVDAKNLKIPGYWSVSVKYFGPLQPADRVPYSMELAYPNSADRTSLWLGLAGLALVLGVLAAWRLLRVVFGANPEDTAQASS